MSDKKITLISKAKRMNLVFVVEKKNVLCVKTFCNIIGKKTNNESN